MPGKWHNDWSKYFENVNKDEYTFIAHQKGRNKTENRCDVLLSSKLILEFQHSNINSKKVEERKIRWKKIFNKDILWIIDGSGDEIIKQKDNTYIIQCKKKWKFKSFSDTGYNYIFYDIDDKIFLLNPNKINNYQIFGNNYINKEDAINYFLNILDTDIEETTIFNYWNKNIINKKAQFIKIQKGAGNGKTYHIWKSICENTDKNCFIITTKLVSAVNVIKEELVEQRSRKEKHIFNMEHFQIENDKRKDRFGNIIDGKKWVIKYTHKLTKRKVIVIIATIDSLTFNLYKPTTKQKQQHGNDIFKKNLNWLYEHGSNTINKQTGGFKFANEYIYLRKTTDLWVDEAQDLEGIYFNAYIRLQEEFNFNFICEGDLLQSCQHADNLFKKNIEDVCRNTLENIEIIIEKPLNINRRIKVAGGEKIINKVINFERWNLPQITVLSKETPLEDEEPFEIVSFGKNEIIKKNETDKSKIDSWVGDILEKTKAQIMKYWYPPSSFLYVFPILKGHFEIEELLSKLQKLWIEIFENEEYLKNCNDYWRENNHGALKKYVEYVQFHQSQNGEPIDLTTSIHKSRIVSILTSKGMGRDVEFTLNVTESSLKQLSGYVKDLQYESYLHTAITRWKRKHFFYLTRNGDDINNRFAELDKCNPYLPKTSKIIKISQIKKYINKNKILSHINIKNIENDEEDDEKINIDWNHHCIRRSVFFTLLIYKARKNQQTKNNIKNKGNQIDKILDIIYNSDIIKCSPKRYWSELKEKSKWWLNEKKNKHEKKNELFIMDIYKKNKVYTEMTNNIYDSIKYIQRNIYKLDKNIEKNDNEVNNTLALIILDHLIEQVRNNHKANPSINDIYNIVNIYNSNIVNKEKEHYNKLQPMNEVVKNIINELSQKYSNINYNVLHKIQYNNKKIKPQTDIKLISTGIPLIGFNNNNVFHFVLKTKYTDFEKNDVILDIMLERFMIKNPDYIEKKICNWDRYKNKKIITILLVLESGKHYIFNDKTLNIPTNKVFENELLSAIKKHYLQIHLDLYNYINKIKKQKDIWRSDNVNTPYLYTYNKLLKQSEYLFPNYILDFLKQIDFDWRRNSSKKNEIKSLFKSKDVFVEHLNDILEDHLMSLFNLHNNYDDDF